MFKLESSIDNDKYDLDRFMKPVDNQKTMYFDVVDSEFLLGLKQISKFGTYRIFDEEGRPDLLSERIYGPGRIQYWWIIMLFNNFRLPGDIKRGMIVKFPTVTDLENIYVDLLPNINSSKISKSSIMVKDKPLVRKESLDSTPIDKASMLG